jgi:hypothetical protein
VASSPASSAIGAAPIISSVSSLSGAAIETVPE